MRFSLCLLLACAGAFLISSCAAPSAVPSQHGTLSDLSVGTLGSENAPELCEHRVPKDVCTRHNPALVEKFKAANDWCGEHGLPESQCFECHPDLSFSPLPKLRPGADLQKLSGAGEDVLSLEAQTVRGKVTVFDFYADWCAPCRRIDAHLYRVLNQRDDVALRKLNVVSWETPLAARYLKNVEGLPYLVVYDKAGRKVREIRGFHLDQLDAAIAEASAR